MPQEIERKSPFIADAHPYCPSTYTADVSLYDTAVCIRLWLVFSRHEEFPVIMPTAT